MVTRRVTQRAYLLRPDAETVQIYLYCLAEAALRFGILLHAWLVMSNHEHIVCTDTRGNYPEFLAHLHKMTAKAMNRLRGRRENFWSSEQPHVLHLVGPDDVFARIIYALANPIAEDLVDRASDWPGASSLQLNLSGREVVVQRPRGFFRDAGPMPKEVTLRVERPKGFEQLTDKQWHDEIAAALKGEEDSRRQVRMRENIRVLGRKGVLNTDPMSQPTTEEPHGKPRPTIACRDHARREQAFVALRGFRAAYRSARLKWCAGDRTTLFPVGTYRMLRFGARCATSDDAAAATLTAQPTAARVERADAALA